VKPYGVVTMDIVKSRTIYDRELVLNKLKSYFKEINNKYSSSLVSDICFTLGDEWQLITNKPQQCYSIVHDFQKLLWQDNISIYAGIGVGEIRTDIHKDTRQMDGPCFIMAREAINIAKEASRRRNYLIQSKLNRIYFKAQAAQSSGIENFLPGYCSIGYSDIDLNEVAADREPIICINDIINVLIENNEILKGKLTHKQKRYMQIIKSINPTER
jgi:hypothetical protein